MLNAGSSERKARIRPLTRQVEESVREAERACKLTVRRWYRSEIKNASVREKFFLSAKTSKHKGTVTLDEEVKNALVILIYSSRNYSNLVKRIYDDIAVKFGRERNKTGRELEAFEKNLCLLLEVFEAERDRDDLMGQLGSMLSNISPGLGANFSGYDEAVADLESVAKSFKRTLQAKLRRLDSAPGLIYQCQMKMRYIPEAIQQ